MNNPKRILGFYNYTVLLTYAGLLAGFLGIVCAMNRRPRAALACLLAAGACDMFDGAVAATLERGDAERRFGVQIDSLSDLVCFGVLPAVFLCSLSGSSPLCLCVAGAYLLCALIRLAYFNVQEEERQRRGEGRRARYTGMPVTMMAVFLPAMNAACRLRGVGSPLPYCALMALSGAAYLSPIPIRKPRLAGKLLLMALGALLAAALISSAAGGT